MKSNQFADDSIERKYLKKGFKKIIGTDEVGRGPGAGPVFAVAVHIPKEKYELFLGKVRDSKNIKSKKKKEELFNLIKKNCKVTYKSINNKEIDKTNILIATKKAMKHCVKSHKDADLVLVDGPIKLDVKIEQKSIIKGDSKSISIASASIVAKVLRDKYMEQIHNEFPEYNWKGNKGYLTLEHRKAIKKYGTTKYHRLSFKNDKGMNK